MRHYPFSIIIAITIWVVCMIPVPETPLSEISFIDKWTHFAMYATFTLSILIEHQKCSKVISKEEQAISKPSPKFTYSLLLIPYYFRIAGLTILMGCLVELAQAYLTTCRSGDWFDALCNTLGSILGLTIFSLVMRFVQKKR